MSAQAARLRQARIEAGFDTAAAAAQRFGWTYATYAGHENGHRGIKLPDLQKYARAFGVSASWLFSGRAQATEAPRAGGFNEPQVVEFTGRSDSERRRLLDLARTIAPMARHPALYQMARPCPGAMLLAGDVLLIDANPTPRDGDLLVARVTLPETGEAVTELAQFRGGAVLPLLGERDFLADGGEAAPVGSVLGSVRLDRRR